MKCHQIHTNWLLELWLRPVCQSYFIQLVLAPLFMGLMLFISNKQMNVFQSEISGYAWITN